MSERSGPLSNLRVLDLSRVFAGPFVAQLFGDLGADVVKVERPRTGDDFRHAGVFLKDKEGKPTREPHYYLSANRNKKSITVNLASKEGQDIVRRLVAQSDVLVENYKTGDLAGYGLDYESLKSVNSRLVYCSMTGFGQTGPYKERPGYDSLFQAMSGIMNMTGHPDGEPGAGPMKTGVIVGDFAGAFHAAFGSWRRSTTATG
jgi:crotonobetainyl-CoA:carnitine CoA-transferase CaiB-like acyl-CoA transferase